MLERGGEAEYVRMQSAAAKTTAHDAPKRLTVCAVSLALVSLALVGFTFAGPQALAVMSAAKAAKIPHTGEWCTGSGAASYSKRR